MRRYLPFSIRYLYRLDVERAVEIILCRAALAFRDVLLLLGKGGGGAGGLSDYILQDKFNP